MCVVDYVLWNSSLARIGNRAVLFDLFLGTLPRKYQLRFRSSIYIQRLDRFQIFFASIGQKCQSYLVWLGLASIA